MRHVATTQKRTTMTVFVTGVFLLMLLALTITVMQLSQTKTASAVDKSSWIAGNIISDEEFTANDSMSVSDIQYFLDKKLSNCDMWGTGIATEYNSSLTRAQYAASRGWAGPPYVCLNKYYEVPKTDPGGTTPVNNYNSTASIPDGAKSAAWIIKSAADTYNINPKVLLVKLATESSGPLTADTWPLYSQYKYAMGSHCPDSGPNGSANCDSNYAGFSIQIYSAAGLMRSYLDNMSQSWWSYKKPYQYNDVLWNVKETGCGSAGVYIENKATAALYTYTPYQPNQAALNNMYGTGDGCSAYGNRNFWRVYWDWFGSTRSEPKDLTSKATNTLRSGEKLNTGEFITSEDGNYMLVMQYSGQLVLYQGRSAIWQSTNTNESENSYAVVQSDGNLVIYTAAGAAQWASGTAGGDNGSLVLQNDGNLVLYPSAGSALWASDTARSVANIKNIGQSLLPGATIKTGEYMKSSDWRYYIDMQTDGNLVLYTAGRAQAVWSSNTAGKGGKYVVMQADGNLVMYGDKGAVWSSETAGRSGLTSAILQDDGNLVLYKTTSNAIWSSNTAGKGGKYVVMQADGNLVVYGDKGAVWSSETAGKGGNAQFPCTEQDTLQTTANGTLKSDTSLCSSSKKQLLVMQADGNLVTYLRNTDATWASQTGGKFIKSDLRIH